METTINNKDALAETETAFWFETDSKGFVKPMFKGSIKRLIRDGEKTGSVCSIEEHMTNDLKFLTKLAQDALNNTPVIPVNLRPKEK